MNTQHNHETHTETAGEAHAAMHKAERLAEKEQEEREEENERLMIFSDGVIAFALTIAAVSIKIPKNLEELNTVVFGIRLFSYLLSFIFVYNLWREHHSIFHHIKRNDGWLITLNSLYLALVVLIPVSLNIMDVGLIDIALHPEVALSSSNIYSFLLFLGSLLGASIMLPLMWRYAQSKQSNTLFEDTQPEKAFLVYTNWRLSAIPISLLFYIPAYIMLALNYWEIGVGIVVGYTVIRWLFFSFYRRRLQENLDLSIGNEDMTRIQLFSDAIVGIAITIVAAQIDPSFNFEDHNAVATVLTESWSLLGTYVFSFVLMGVYWLLHYHLFRLIKRYDSVLLGLNFVFLLLIILMFIPARLYTSHMSSHVYALLFSCWQVITAGVLWAIWQYASYKTARSHEYRLLKRNIPSKRRKRFARILLINPLIFVGLALASIFLPIPTTAYIVIYLALLGSTWTISHWSTKKIEDLFEQDPDPKVPAEVATV
ncbi:hypothetical protein KSX_92050 [Ktedonospora formicarum]|uniref:DUF1211 domain-containing protein n=2 Tax=Ktedonospora formicarum TaxID=2778364 RepID=A0A8J3MW43_9CHLR|nr:hypothetical protein KSX_92050 [Ktedonospora formicarum]